MLKYTLQDYILRPNDNFRVYKKLVIQDNAFLTGNDINVNIISKGKKRSAPAKIIFFVEKENNIYVFVRWYYLPQDSSIIKKLKDSNIIVHSNHFDLIHVNCINNIINVDNRILKNRFFDIEKNNIVHGNPKEYSYLQYWFILKTKLYLYTK